MKFDEAQQVVADEPISVEEKHTFICQMKTHAQDDQVLVKVEVKLEDDNQFTQLWSYLGLLFFFFEALLVFMLEPCLQWMRRQRNNEGERRFRFLLVLNYVAVVRHIHLYINAPNHELDVQDVENANQRPPL